MAIQEDTGSRYARSEDIKAILAMKTIAIVGLSPDPFRPSQTVALYMQRHGYRVIPVNPYCDFVLNEKVYPNLESVPFRSTSWTSFGGLATPVRRWTRRSRRVRRPSGFRRA
jgi:hypothetical protein